MWQRIDLNRQWERMLGFTLPVDHRVIVIAIDALYLIDLHRPRSIVSDERFPEGESVYDYENQVVTYEGQTHHVLGLYGGSPIIWSGRGEVLEVDTEREILRIAGLDGKIALEFHYSDVSGDWLSATFSQDDEYVLLGVPYDLYAFRRLPG
jgi:hypothetical protein